MKRWLTLVIFIFALPVLAETQSFSVGEIVYSGEGFVRFYTGEKNEGQFSVGEELRAGHNNAGIVVTQVEIPYALARVTSGQLSKRDYVHYNPSILSTISIGFFGGGNSLKEAEGYGGRRGYFGADISMHLDESTLLMARFQSDEFGTGNYDVRRGRLKVMLGVAAEKSGFSIAALLGGLNMISFSEEEKYGPNVNPYNGETEHPGKKSKDDWSFGYQLVTGWRYKIGQIDRKSPRSFEIGPEITYANSIGPNVYGADVGVGLKFVWNFEKGSY